MIARTSLLTVRKSYVYDDGDESQGNDTFEREPYIVHFHSPSTGKIRHIRNKHLNNIKNPKKTRVCPVNTMS